MKYLNRGRPPSPPVDTSTPNSQPLRRIGGTHRLDQDSPGGGSIQRVFFVHAFLKATLKSLSNKFCVNSSVQYVNFCHSYLNVRESKLVKTNHVFCLSRSTKMSDWMCRLLEDREFTAVTLLEEVQARVQVLLKVPASQSPTGRLASDLSKLLTIRLS